MLSAFEELHRGLTRQGPGDDENTERALRAAGPIRPGARIVDLACGPGAHTLVLASSLRYPVLAIDQHEPFLEELRQRATAEGVASLVETQVGDLNQLDLEPGSVDLLWCEAAIYVVGFERGLQSWWDLLRPGGVAVVSELCWLTDSPVGELRDYWSAAYPGIRTVADNAAAAERIGYRVREHFSLNAEAWWSHYYQPLEARLGPLRSRFAGDPEAEEVFDETAREIEMFRRYGNDYGYVFFVLEKPAAELDEARAILREVSEWLASDPNDAIAQLGSESPRARAARFAPSLAVMVTEFDEDTIEVFRRVEVLLEDLDDEELTDAWSHDAIRSYPGWRLVRDYMRDAMHRAGWR